MSNPNNNRNSKLVIWAFIATVVVSALAIGIFMYREIQALYG
ncbi:hypothetical protein [Brevibacillus composti]|nr:hypothetical protein [Brevibacillus composti]